ncbi:MAG: hypothetical protein QXG12_07170 [Thermoproteota archaeon]
MSLSRILIPLTIFALALTLRLYPYLSTGIPSHTDSWPLIRNVENLAKHTPVDLNPSKGFDNYNVYWPTVMVYTVVLSALTGLPVFQASALSVPLASALGVHIFLALSKKFSNSSPMAYASAILLASMAPHVIISSGITKEGYAHPLYLTTLMLLMLGLLKGRWSFYLASILSFTTLLLAHHFTSLILLLASLSFTLTLSLFQPFKQLNRKLAATIITYLILTALYYQLHALKGLPVKLDFNDWLALWSFETISAAPVVFTFARHRSSFDKIYLCTVLALAASLALISVRVRVLEDAPTLPIHMLLTATPYMALAVMAVLGWFNLRDAAPAKEFTVLKCWIMSLLGLLLYGFFASQSPLTFIIRVPSFLYPPLFILAPIGLKRLLKGVGESKYKLSTSIVWILITLGFLNHWYSYLFTHGKYSGAYHIYDVRDLNVALWLRYFMAEGSTTSSDIKYGYLLSGYLNLSFNPYDCLTLIYGSNAVSSQNILVYRYMDVDGYVGGAYAVPLTVTISKLDGENSLSRVYDDGENIVYGAGREHHK